MTEPEFTSGKHEEIGISADPVGYIPPLENDPRPDWDSYFMEVARLVSIRTTCLARRVGAVIVRDRRIVSTGYNGAASGLPHCIDLGCLKRGLGIPSGERTELCRGSCAEENAIVQAARFGFPVKGGWIYITNQPCLKCARMIINVGLEGVTFAGDYPQPMALEFLQEAGIILNRYDFEIREIRLVEKVPVRFLVKHAHRGLTEALGASGAGNAKMVAGTGDE
jgi:dCMP deaminase